MPGKTANRDTVRFKQDDDDELRRRWHDATRGIGTPMLRDDIYGELVSAYTAADRHYHDIRHIADCLRQFDGVRHFAHNPDALQTAIWFHDVVYDGRRTDNEEQSAKVAAAALRRLGASEAHIEEVQQLIVFTRHDTEPDTADGKLMVDIDLASLALAPERFDENSRRIRNEYLHVPEEAFIRGRNDMLGSLLKRPRIYYTAVFYDRFEGQARENLERVVGGGSGIGVRGSGIG
jgi:predicted metal-dependent HD superfamily phosphohydrolase